MKSLTASLLLGLLLAVPSSLFTAHAAGPLNPPGAPGDGSNGGPSLTEVKAAVDALAAQVALSDGRTRIPAQTATYTIAQPGNYVLTGDIAVASGNGINITGSNITLDLNGFSIRSTAAAPAGNGILISGASKHVVIRNGRIRGDGSTGFEMGIRSNFLVVEDFTGFVFEDIQMEGVGITLEGPFSPTVPPHQMVTARRVTIGGSGGIRFFLVFGALSEHPLGSVIDCHVSGNIQARKVDSSSIGGNIVAHQVVSSIAIANIYARHVVNSTAGGTISADHKFNSAP